MNHKQKLGYMAIGAGILALGIIIGQWVTPDIEAQNNGVFDTIECKRLVILDGQGKDAIMLSATEKQGNGMIIYQDEGKQGLVLRSTKETSNVTAYNSQGKAVVVLAAGDELGGVLALNYGDGEGGVSLGALGTFGSVLSVGNPDSKTQVKLQSNNILGTTIEIIDSAGNTKWTAP